MATNPPAQPPLVATLSGGILTYCGLMVAGVAALMATDRFGNLWLAFRLAGLVTTVLSLAGGSLALLSLANSINHARRVEKGAAQASIDSARIWSMRLSNVSLYTIAGASVTAAVTIGAFALNVSKDAPSKDYLIDVGSSNVQGPALPKTGQVTCYVQPRDAAKTLPARVCVFTP